MDTAKWKRWIEEGKPELALKRMRDAAKEQEWYDLEDLMFSLLSQLNSSREKTMAGFRTTVSEDQVERRVSHSAQLLLLDMQERFALLKEKGNWVSEDDIAISLFMRGQKEYAAGHTAKAIELFTQALEEAPLFAEAYVERGVAYTAKSPPDYPAAIKDFNNALRTRPGLPTALLNRGIVYYTYLEDYPKACKDWREAYAGGLEMAKDYLDEYCKP